MLKEAAACYQECLRSEAADEELRARVRHNLELVELIRLGLPPESNDSRPNQSENPPANTHKPERERPQEHHQPGSVEPGHGRPDQKVGRGVGQQTGQDATATDSPPQPGEGTQLPTIPDRGELVPMAPEDSQAYLRRRADLIRQQGKQHAESRAKVPGPHVKDW